MPPSKFSLPSTMAEHFGWASTQTYPVLCLTLIYLVLKQHLLNIQVLQSGDSHVIRQEVSSPIWKYHRIQK